jgi:hypothetical protein
MSKWVGIGVAVAMILSLGACGQREPADTTDVMEPGPIVMPPAERVEPLDPVDAPDVDVDVTVITPPAEEEEEYEVEPMGDDPALEDEAKAGLVGPQWRLDDYVATFHQDNTLTVQAGGMEIPASYRLLANNVIEIEVPSMGTTLSGTWDGSDLVINGDSLERIQ